MAHKISQREKVEHILRANGKRGVHTFELRQAYIANPSERIRELRELGWKISAETEKLNGTAIGSRYVKLSEPDAERGGREPGFAKPSPSTPSLSTGGPNLGPRTLWEPDGSKRLFEVGKAQFGFRKEEDSA